MVLRWVRGFPSDDVNESDSDEDVAKLPWWEKVSHPDPQVRMQGRREEQEETEANARYDRD